MYFEEEEGKEINLYKIIKNFEDLNNPPPDYYELFPEVDLEKLSHLPKYNIQIADGCSSMDKMKEVIVNCKLETIKHKMDKSKKKMSFTKVNKIREKIYGDLNDNKEKQEHLLLIKETYDRSLIDLKIIKTTYVSICTNLNLLYNNYVSIIVNPNMNEKNKKVKIIQVILEFSEEFKKSIKNFKEKNIKFNCLSNIKDELIKTCINKFQIIVAYIIHSKSISNVELKNLIEIE